MSFVFQKVLSFRRSRVFIFPLRLCVTDVMFRKWSPVPCLEGYFPFSLLSLPVGQIYRSLSPLDLIIVHGNDMDLFAFLYMLIKLCHNNLLQMISFSIV